MVMKNIIKLLSNKEEKRSCLPTHSLWTHQRGFIQQAKPGRLKYRSA